MNFLGHLALAAPNKDLMVGGFLGDFVKGDFRSAELKNKYPSRIEAGIRLHRRIDARSDCHPSLAALRSEFPKEWSRYLGILVDLYCDHLISNPTNELLEEPIAEFSKLSYRTLEEQLPIFSESAKRVFKRMYQGRWLEQYADPEFTAASLMRIGRRFKFDNPLANSRKIIAQHETSLNRHCHSLYADMQQVVAEWQADEARREP